MGIILETISGDLLLALVILVATAWYYVIRKFGYWQDRNVPFVKPSFPFGNFINTYLLRKSFGEVSVDIYGSSDAPVLGLWSALKPLLLIRDPELVQRVLIKDFSSFSDRGFYCDEERDPLSAHIFSFPTDKWRHIRAQVTPSFTVGKIRATFPTLVVCGGSLDSFAKNMADQESTIEVREIMAQYTTNVIASVAFGIEIDCIANPDEPLRKMGRRFFEPSFKSSVRQGIAFLYPQIIPWLGIRWLDQDLEELLMSIVEQNLDLRENKNVVRNDFFQLLVQLRNMGKIKEEDEDFTTTVNSENKSLSLVQCAAQTFIFFLAGFETTSSAMSFALYELAKNPECLRRVHQEIDEVMAKHNGEITYEAISELKYLDWCIDETLRMYPSLPIINRQSTESWTIPNTSTTIEKGTAILIPAWALHNDPKYWPNPERFWPERFSPEQTVNHTFLTNPYLPFGVGPRNCIGLKLGKLQTKMGLFVMLRKYSYELTESSKLPMKVNPALFTITPQGGINLKITHRRKKPFAL